MPISRTVCRTIVRIGPNIFSKGLVTQDWRHVGDGIRSLLRESFVQIHSATRMQILFLSFFATVTQWNDLAVLTNSLNCSSATLVG
jgi:hypothetical protein